MIEALSIRLLKNKFHLTAYLESLEMEVLPKADVIDVSGALIASAEWRQFCLGLSWAEGVVWRILLLAPDSRAARVRAMESSVWNGDVEALRSAIFDRSRAIESLARELGVALEIRYRTSIPVTRYMRFNDEVFESYYPSNSTGRNTPIAVLPPNSVLALRVIKEFEVSWQESGGLGVERDSVAVGPQECPSEGLGQGAAGDTRDRTRSWLRGRSSDER